MSDKEMRSAGVQEATANSLPALGVEEYRSEGVKTNVSSALKLREQLTKSMLVGLKVQLKFANVKSKT